jgi:ADP-heptose:LPS heptosyltransferase
VRRETQDSGNIILVRADNIGDFILWLPYAKFYREYFSDKHIILVVNKSAADLAAIWPYWDTVVAIDRIQFRRNIGYRTEVLKRLARSFAGKVINANPNPDFGVSDSIVISLCCSSKVGFSCEDSKKGGIRGRLRKSIYNDWFKIKGPRHEIEKNKSFAEMLTGRTVAPGWNGLDLSSLQNSSQRVVDEPYFLILPGATWVGRRWPAERFAVLADRLSAETGWKCVVCGSSDEVGIASLIERRAKCEILNMAGRTTLRQLLELIYFSRLVVGNESAGMHLANAVGVKSVCILGGGHFGRFLPYPEVERTNWAKSVTWECFGCDWECKFGRGRNEPVKCIDVQSIDLVFELSRDAIRSGAGGPDPVARRIDYS